MKRSRFNVFVPTEDGKEIIYNTLSGSLTKVNHSLAETLRDGDTRNIGFTILRKLENQDVMICVARDEMAEYRDMHERWKTGREKVEFNALLTYDCNFECPYCYQGRGDVGKEIHGFRSMTPEFLESVKSFIKTTTEDRAAKAMDLVIYGGEPFLPNARYMGRDLVGDVSGWADENDVKFALQILSNGSLMREEDIEWLNGYSARVQIPVDGDPEMHDRYRFYKNSGKGSFEDIAKVLAMTKGSDIETHIRISLTEETYPTMDNMLSELRDRGLTHVYPDFCYITAFTDACSGFEEHTLSDAKLFSVMPELWRKAHELGFPLDIRPKVKPLPCSSIADGSFIIDPFGEVYKCWEHVGLKEHIVGVLDNDGNFTKTEVYGDVLRRNPCDIKGCSDHNYLPSCGGGCVCKAQWQEGTYHARGCGTEKFLLKDKIKTYVETQTGNNLWTMENGYAIQIIEGVQEPDISHCYVLV
jgi:uncharacterized protein